MGVVACDGLLLAFTEAEAEVLTFRAEHRRDAGAPITIIDARAAREVEPGLGEGVLSAGHCKIDGYANAYLTGLAYRRALLEAGVQVHENRAVTWVEREAGGFALQTAQGTVRARRLVMAGGVWIEPMLAWLGVTLPIKTLGRRRGSRPACASWVGSRKMRCARRSRGPARPSTASSNGL